MNEFGDLTTSEFFCPNTQDISPTMCGEALKHLGTHEYVGETLVDAVHWITKGAVAPAKNQGQCGSC